MPAIRRRPSRASASPPLSLPSLTSRINKASRLRTYGKTAHANADLLEAFVIFSACIELDGLQEVYWLNRSLVAFELGLYSRSIEDATQALACISAAREAATPEMWERLRGEAERLAAKAHLRRAEACLRLGLIDQASKDIEQVHWDDDEVAAAKNTIRIVSSASMEEQFRWLRAQRPKRSIKRHPKDEEGVFERAEYDRKLEHYMNGDF